MDLTNGINSASQRVEPSLMDYLREKTPVSIDQDVFRATQMRHVKRLTPVVMLTTLIIAAVISSLSWPPSVHLAVSIWTLIVCLMAGGTLVLWWRGRLYTPVRTSQRTITKAVLISISFAIAFAVLPVITYDMPTGETKLIVSMIGLSSAGILAIHLARIPRVAISGSWLILSALCGSMVLSAMQQAPAAIVFCSSYGLMLAILISTIYRSSVKRVEAMHQLSNQRNVIELLLQDLETGTCDWLWEVDADGRLIYTSTQLPDALGLRLNQVLGQPICKLSNADTESPEWQNFCKLLAKREPIQGVELPVNVGSQPGCWQLTGRYLPETGGYRGVGRDLTMAKRQAAEILRAKEEAEQSGAAKSRLLAVMSHELRNPLNAITGFSAMIKDDRDNQLDPGQIREFAETIHHSGEHMLQLIDDILDISRIERGQLKLSEQEIELTELLEVTCRIAQQQADARQVILINDLLDNEFVFTGDLTRLKQIIINLLSNAIKFTRPGMDVRISMLLQQSGDIHIQVRDRGIGIDEDALKRIFLPFFQGGEGASARLDGVGLGLSIANTLAKMHGGRIEVESVLGEGTSATLVLPADRIISIDGVATHNRAA